MELKNNCENFEHPMSFAVGLDIQTLKAIISLSGDSSSKGFSGAGRIFGFVSKVKSKLRTQNAKLNTHKICLTMAKLNHLNRLNRKTFVENSGEASALVEVNRAGRAHRENF